MNVNELESKDLVNDKPEAKEKEPKQPKQSAENQSIMLTRSLADWNTILRLSVVLALLVGLVLGSVVGFFVGKGIYQGTGTTEQTQPNENEDSIYSKYDYTKFVINAEKNVTIESFYADDEERFFAMQLIGEKIPDFKYLNTAEEELKISELGKDKYIIEFLEPDCAFCNATIEVMDSYRKTENAMDVVGLSIKDGDISKFNKDGETTFMLVNKDADTKEIVDLVMWVPTFLYIESGEIVLVTFGKINSVEDFQKNIDIAFN